MNDWFDLFDWDEPEKVSHRKYNMGPERTPAYYAARFRRVERLREQIEAGVYEIPAELVAECILLGAPKWGEALIDKNGDRIDEIR